MVDSERKSRLSRELLRLSTRQDGQLRSPARGEVWHRVQQRSGVERLSGTITSVGDNYVAVERDDRVSLIPIENVARVDLYGINADADGGAETVDALQDDWWGG